MSRNDPAAAAGSVHGSRERDPDAEGENSRQRRIARRAAQRAAVATAGKRATQRQRDAILMTCFDLGVPAPLLHTMTRAEATDKLAELRILETRRAGHVSQIVAADFEPASSKQYDLIRRLKARHGLATATRRNLTRSQASALISQLQ